MEVKDLVDEFFRNNPDLLEEGPYRQNDQNIAISCLIEISDKSNSKSIRKKSQDCDTKFFDAEDLETHMENAHNAEKYDLEVSGKCNNTTCNKCNEDPLHENCLETHMRIKHWFICNMCDAEFTNETNLTKHKENIHEAEKSNLKNPKEGNNSEHKTFLIDYMETLPVEL